MKRSGGNVDEAGGASSSKGTKVARRGRNDPQTSVGDDDDDQRALSLVELHENCPRRKVGVILKVTLKNFMCHKDFQLEFSPNACLNFIR